MPTSPEKFRLPLFQPLLDPSPTQIEREASPELNYAKENLSHEPHTVHRNKGRRRHGRTIGELQNHI
jgi:hypothetical protein